MKESTSKFKVKELIYDDGSFAIAKGYWNKCEHLSLGCRWYEEEGIGYPQTFGKPQWMLLPDKLKVSVSDILKKTPEVNITFPSNKN